MENYILFTPAGKTDPITSYHDGAILHICRKYKPSKVYLYLSKEMLQFHELDDRYCKCLRWLREKEQFDLDIQVISRPELVDVHLFDRFYDDFEMILNAIQKENPDAQILLNVSSGTPAMKSALQFIAASSDNVYLPIQVSTPEKRANREPYDFEAYELELKWELNEDNQENYSDRCEESVTILLNKRVKREIIIKHISAYDYQAALQVAETIEKQLSQKTMNLLKGAAHRLTLDIGSTDKFFEKAAVDCIPVKSSNQRIIFEYILWLQIKQKRGDLADFIRGISPILTDLMTLVAENICHFDVSSCCDKTKKGVEQLSRIKLSQKYPEILKILDKEFGRFEDSPLSAASLAIIIEKLCPNDTIKDLAVDLRKVEEKARNIAAHEIVSITEEWIEKKTGFTPAKILAMLQKLVQLSLKGITKESWCSYDEMNEKIIESFQENKAAGENYVGRSL